MTKNTLNELKLIFRKLEQECNLYQENISDVLSNKPCDWTHIHNKLYDFVAPTNSIEEVLEKMRKLERTPNFL